MNHISKRDSGISTTPKEGTTNNATPILSQRGNNINYRMKGIIFAVMHIVSLVLLGQLCAQAKSTMS